MPGVRQARQHDGAAGGRARQADVAAQAQAPARARGLPGHRRRPPARLGRRREQAQRAALLARGHRRERIARREERLDQRQHAAAVLQVGPRLGGGCRIGGRRGGRRACHVDHAAALRWPR
jgi:hypothetical protein